MNGANLTEQDRDILFRNARTFSYWLDRPVDEKKLQELYDLMKYCPTAANSNPLRIVFVKTKEAKERLRPALNEGNVEKTMKAPVTAILAYDMEFYESLPRLYPQVDAKSWFEGHDDLIKASAILNSSLQIGYFILAARGCGLDCGPMAGFDNETVDDEFFAKNTIKSSLLCNLGYGDKSRLHTRNPRFTFEEVCKVI